MAVLQTWWSAPLKSVGLKEQPGRLLKWGKGAQRMLQLAIAEGSQRHSYLPRCDVARTQFLIYIGSWNSGSMSNIHGLNGAGVLACTSVPHPAA